MRQRFKVLNAKESKAITKRATLLALCLCFLWTRALAVISRQEERIFEVSDVEVASLQMEIFHGSILILEGTPGEIKVQIRKEFVAESPEQADRIERNLTLETSPTPTGLTLKASYSRSVHWTFENWPPVRLGFTLWMPPKSDIDLYTHDGGVTVNRLVGKAKVRTQWGLIYFKGWGGDLMANSEFGDIVVAHCTGNLKLRSISGSFRVGPVRGTADVFGWGGEIEVQSAGAGVIAETSGSNLQVGLRYPIVAPASLRTGGASILVTVDPRSECTFDLQASMFGRIVNVKDRLPLVTLSGAVGKSRGRFTLNGGGPLVEARASGGHVYVEGADMAGDPPPFDALGMSSGHNY